MKIINAATTEFLMPETALWPLHTSIVLFITATAVIAVCGVMVTGQAERLARDSGLGQALMGAVFLGAMTSLSGLITSLTAAYEGHPQLSVSNAVGGIAVQTSFLALADILYRKANLEHAAATEANLVQGAVLVTLLALALLAGFTPALTLFGVHPMSLLLIAAYGFGLRLISGAHNTPMWRPRITRQTRSEDKRSRPPGRRRLPGLWASFLVLASLVAAGGWVVANAGLSIVAGSGLSEGVVGTLLTATATSLPEAVIAVAAVRRGALTLAVGDIIGGNTFDVLFLAFSDLMYRGGSLYHAVTTTQSFWLTLSLVMSAVVLLGLMRREEHGIGNIGFESFLVLVFYLGGVVLLVFAAAP
jgi:cation:H+ antiporter